MLHQYDYISKYLKKLSNKKQDFKFLVFMYLLLCMDQYMIPIV